MDAAADRGAGESRRRRRGHRRARRRASPRPALRCRPVRGRARGREDTHTQYVACTVTALDSGFVVCNERNYPVFLVAHAASSVSRCGRRTCPSPCAASAASSSSPGRGAARPVRAAPQSRAPLVRCACSLDLQRFFRNARAVLDDPGGGARHDRRVPRRAAATGAGSTDHFLAPMGAAIWSSSPARMRSMPARFFLALLRQPRAARRARRAAVAHHRGRVAALRRRARSRLRGAVSARRAGAQRFAAASDGVELSRGRQRTRALRSRDPGLPSRPGARAARSDRSGRRAGRARAYPLLAQRGRRPHATTRCCPAACDGARILERGARGLPRGATRPVAITYWMNRLQGLPDPTDYCVSLNQSTRIDRT